MLKTVKRHKISAHIKTANGQINYERLLQIADSKNFSQLSQIGSDGEIMLFDVSDDGEGSNAIWNGADAEIILLDLLSKFNDKQKIILLYQVLRECGYKIRHEDCAKSLSLSREWYMTLLKEVMQKARKALQSSSK